MEDTFVLIGIKDSADDITPELIFKGSAIEATNKKTELENLNSLYQTAVEDIWTNNRIIPASEKGITLIKEYREYVQSVKDTIDEQITSLTIPEYYDYHFFIF